MPFYNVLIKMREIYSSAGFLWQPQSVWCEKQRGFFSIEFRIIYVRQAASPPTLVPMCNGACRDGLLRKRTLPNISKPVYIIFQQTLAD